MYIKKKISNYFVDLRKWAKSLTSSKNKLIEAEYRHKHEREVLLSIIQELSSLLKIANKD